METFPPMPLDAWRDTKETLHRFAQIVGKIRLAASIPRNHWWHVPFHLSGRGITTRPMGRDPIFTIDFDFLDHRLDVTNVDGRRVSFPLIGKSVASFYRATFEALDAIGVDVTIGADPFDLPDATPFPDDTHHDAYDPSWVTRYWVVLSQVNLLLEEFASGFSGKISPVHHFWHGFDIAVTRFSSVRVDMDASVDPVTREAYSREVISAGFWFGDDKVPEPAFYSYTAPEPDGLTDQPLRPAAARWAESGTGHLALLTYDDARATADPWATVLDFLASAYRAGAGLAGWDVEALASPGGVTDPTVQ
jgi:Family of unknown function (DUF5996)